MVNNGKNQFGHILQYSRQKKAKYYLQFHILMEQLLIGCSPDWKKNLKMKTKNKSKKRSKCFTSLTISVFP